MTERSRNISVGITAILGAVGLGVLLLMFGTLPALRHQRYNVTITLPSASGLNAGSRVRVAGIEVGRITKVQLAPPPVQGVLVNAGIDTTVDLPEGTAAVVSSPLLGGMAALDLYRPDQSKNPDAPAAAMLPKDGSAKIEGDAPSLTGTFSKELRGALQGPLAEFERTAVSMRELSKKWSEVAENIAALTAQRAPADVDASDGKLLGNFATVLARADQRLAEMQKTIDGINEWVADQKFRQDIQQTAANAREMSERMKVVVDEAGQNFERLTKRYIAVADDMSASIASMRAAIDQARQGQGTVGKMLNDPALFNNLNDASARLNKALDEFKLLLEKWKAEGLPVQF